MTVYRLPEQFDIRVIADVHRELAAALATKPARTRAKKTASKTQRARTSQAKGRPRRSSQRRCIDAAAVERVDSAGVQLLAAVLSDATGGDVTLADPAPCLLQAFEAAGLEHLLNTDKVT